ncbi:glycosyltransferase family 2 protein [Kytococcus schroeteri]|uniref:glycosyltransferase family 2 protein n=1 Tax=Kytococcus schroeteri TaxID=138300 RepID=UPI0015DD9A28|nr:glycosyltransferase family A protein [Kytococcus schroeteri]
MAPLRTARPAASLTDHAVDAARHGADEAGFAWLAAAAETPLALLHTALRTDAPVLVETLARVATDGALSMPQLAAHVETAPTLEAVLAPTVAGPALAAHAGEARERLLHQVGCVAAFWSGRALDEESTARGLRLFEALLETHGAEALPPKLRAIPLQQALLSGRPELARRWVDLPGARKQIVQGVRTDLARLDALGEGATAPQPGSAAEVAWLESLNTRFTQSRCTPVTLTASGSTPYDRMEAAAPHHVEDGPLVTVLMPCWQPDAEGLVTSVRSITAQTWRRLEILVLDDASGPEFDAVFEQVGRMDPRITVVRMPANGGSYVARNHGIGISHGEYVTVQDADDWSHPERIERHVRDLEAHPKVPANRSQAIRVKDDLTHQWLGYPPDRRNASSLMVRRSVLEEVGGFQAVRKGADSEYHFRLDALGRPVRDIDDYLAVIRLSTGSLSRGDFMWNRNNPDRLLYRGVYAAWHRAIRRAGGGKGPRSRQLAGASGIDSSATMPFSVPRAWNRDLPAPDGGRYPSSGEEVTHAWVLRGDFSQPERVAQLREFLDAGIRPVLWHQERPLPLTERRPELAGAVGDLIVAEGLTYVSANEATLAQNLLVLDAGLAARDAGKVRAERVWLDADRLAEDTGAGSIGDLMVVPGQLREAFGTAPQWVTRHGAGHCGIEGARPAPWRA